MPAEALQIIDKRQHRSAVHRRDHAGRHERPPAGRRSAETAAGAQDAVHIGLYRERHRPSRPARFRRAAARKALSQIRTRQDDPAGAWRLKHSPRLIYRWQETQARCGPTDRRFEKSPHRYRRRSRRPRRRRGPRLRRHRDHFRRARGRVDRRARRRPRHPRRRRSSSPKPPSRRSTRIALSGGSALGLDAAGGVQAWLAEQGRGLRIREAVIPIVPGAICFDLLNGGNKAWGRFPPYRDLGYAAAQAASAEFALGSVGAGLGATTANLKGGLGSASAQTEGGVMVGGARGGQCRRQRHGRRRTVVLGGAVRNRQANSAGADCRRRSRPTC